MRKNIFGAFLFLIVLTYHSSAQTSQANTLYPQAFNKGISLNPNADHDVQLVENYLRAVTGGDAAKARTLIAPGSWSYGPGIKDSSTMEQDIAKWEKNYATELDRKLDFVSMTWRVLADGIYKGDWVANWGTYSFTDQPSGKRLDVSYHFVTRIIDGKIGDNRTYYDNLGPTLKAGYTLQPPKAKKK